MNNTKPTNANTKRTKGGNCAYTIRPIYHPQAKGHIDDYNQGSDSDPDSFYHVILLPYKNAPKQKKTD
jgi:hypothetical protein